MDRDLCNWNVTASHYSTQYDRATTMDSMSICTELQGQTVAAVNCKTVSFLFLFHCNMRVNQMEASETHNQTKNVPCAAAGTESTYRWWNVWQHDEHQHVNRCFSFLSDLPVCTLNIEKWNTVYGYCITNKLHISAIPISNLPHTVPVCPHYHQLATHCTGMPTLQPQSTHTTVVLSQTSHYNYCAHKLICTNINGYNHNSNRTAVIFGLGITKEN
jgi:hypothetical protein